MNRYLSHSKKKLKEENSIIVPEVLCYIESEKSLLLRTEEFQSRIIFWQSILGAIL